MKAGISFLLVVLVSALAYFGAQTASVRPLLADWLPYAALLVFLVGFSYKIIHWAWTPVPFRIPTTCGQQKSLPWITPNRLDNPSTKAGAIGRMALEVLCFRSLFRNTRAELRTGPQLAYTENKFLWLAALAFHWTLLIILLRHLRFFLLPVPHWLGWLDTLDGFFQVGAPVLYLTDVAILVSLLYLLGRRFWDPQIRYISLLADYLALFLLLGLVMTGMQMRYFTKVDLEGVKEYTLGLATFSPHIPATVGPLFFVHLTLMGALLAYIPFSKLMHLGGVFLSPTRNLANNNRIKRHINPWNYPVKVHTYAEWEDEFREKIKAAGLPLEKE
ncbi:MAG: sulfate reduction electron transfer complex DsrMKJOP subunit DsrM [Acidobacteriaceae bacterium]